MWRRSYVVSAYRTRKYCCRAEGLYDQTQYMPLATVLSLIPENAAGCQLFYRKIYGYFRSVYVDFKWLYSKLTLLHLERTKVHRSLPVLSAIR